MGLGGERRMAVPLLPQNGPGTWVTLSRASPALRSPSRSAWRRGRPATPGFPWFRSASATGVQRAGPRSGAGVTSSRGSICFWPNPRTVAFDSVRRLVVDAQEPVPVVDAPSRVIDSLEGYGLPSKCLTHMGLASSEGDQAAAVHQSRFEVPWVDRHSVFLAELRHRVLTAQMGGDELHSLIHDRSLLPRHRLTSKPCQRK